MWYPANRAERALAWALAAGDLPRYVRTLTTADLWQPLGPPGGAGPDGRRLVTVEVQEQTMLPVFTSYEALTDGVAGLAEAGVPAARSVEAAVVVTCAHLWETWPDPRWWLAVDPGSPIEAYLALAAVDRALRGEVATDDPEILAGDLGSGEWEPWPDGPNRAVLDAASLGEVAEYLEALVDSMVTMATTREPAGPQDYLGPEFPWRPVGAPEAPVIELFTSLDAYAAADPGGPAMTVRLAMLLFSWPTRYGLSLNPGGPAGLSLPGPQVPLLVRWLRDTASRGLRVPVPDPVLRGLRWTPSVPVGP